MTFDDLRSFLEKKNRRTAILDADFKLLWEKEAFFSSRTAIKWPRREDFTDKKEVIISVGSGQTKIPVSVTRFTLAGGEIRYICEAFDREIVSELASKSEISELLKIYITGINDKIHVIKHFADQCALNPLVQEDAALLRNYKAQTGAAFDLLALSTNLNFYFNTFSYSDTKGEIDIFKTVDGLVKKCNELLGNSSIILTSKESSRRVKIPERVFTVIFLNLIQNALLYSKADSKISVKLFNDDKENTATVSVTNEIEAGSAPAFESIRLGIGLPLVERIVSGVGGNFTNQREGSTYKAHITLPLSVRGREKEVVFESEPAEFFTQKTSYVQRYLNQFIEE